MPVQLKCVNTVKTERNQPHLGGRIDQYYNGLEVLIDGRREFVPVPFTFQVVGKKWVRIPKPGLEGEYIQFGVDDTGMTPNQLKEFLVRCGSTASNLQVYRGEHDSGDTITLGKKPIQIYLAFREGQEYPYENLETADGKIKFEPDFGEFTGGNKENIVILWT